MSDHTPPPAPTPTPAAASPAAASAPVFVDPTGRRERWVHAAAWALGGLVICYLGLLVVSLVGPPGVLKLAVPGVGPIFPGAQAPRITSGTTHQRPADVFRSHPAPTAPVAPTGVPAPAAPTAAPTATATPRPSATGSPTLPPSPTRGTGSPTSSPTTAPTKRATGKPTARPTPTRSRP